jgi:hypothetical protein
MVSQLTTDAYSEDANLQLQVPKSTKRDLQIRSAEAGEPMRLLVLKALAAYGIHVPEDSLIDRRKPR